MKAARYYGPGDIRVEQIEEPEAGEGQLKVKVRRSEAMTNSTVLTGCTCWDKDCMVSRFTIHEDPIACTMLTAGIGTEVGPVSMSRVTLH